MTVGTYQQTKKPHGIYVPYDLSGAPKGVLYIRIIQRREGMLLLELGNQVGNFLQRQD